MRTKLYTPGCSCKDCQLIRDNAKHFNRLYFILLPAFLASLVFLYYAVTY